jgi:hypothetical protein
MRLNQHQFKSFVNCIRSTTLDKMRGAYLMYMLSCDGITQMELRVPDDYEEPSPCPLGTTTHPEYEPMRLEFSLNNGANPAVGCGKVGADYIYVRKDGTMDVLSEDKLSSESNVSTWRATVQVTTAS